MYSHICLANINNNNNLLTKMQTHISWDMCLDGWCVPAVQVWAETTSIITSLRVASATWQDPI